MEAAEVPDDVRARAITHFGGRREYEDVCGRTSCDFVVPGSTVQAIAPQASVQEVRAHAPEQKIVAPAGS